MTAIHVPDYYPQFQCSGSACEDTCCGGWAITIDRQTYQQYKNNKNPALIPIFEVAVTKNTTSRANNENNYGVMAMRPDGRCHFLQEDQLCGIHKDMGPLALSNTCRIYPRYLNRFGTQRENGLGVSCPEAARLILLNPQPMQFISVAPDPDIDGKPFTSYAYPQKDEGRPQEIAVLNDLRSVIIGVLQSRDLSIAARLMVVGFLLTEVQALQEREGAQWYAHLPALLGTYVDMLAFPAELQAQHAQIAPNIQRKLEWTAAFMKRALAQTPSARFKACLQDAFQGLATYPNGVDQYYTPYFAEKHYIFENYLVNQVYTRLFPLARGTYLDLYRALIGNWALVQMLLTGVALHHKGLDDARVVQTIQTFARFTNHSANHAQLLIEAMQPQPQDSFVHAMWLLKDFA